MERYSLREHVLIGSSSRRSSGSPNLQSRSSDLDFNDVFGGPPRRSSMHEWRNSLGETMNSNSSGGDDEEVGSTSTRSPWSGLSEKPVFGEESLNRRSNQSNDFFDDIFRGDSYSSSTPTRPSRDHFPSTPGSRVLSPARSLPSQSEPFGSSSVPLLLSVTAPSHSTFKGKEISSNGLGFPSSPILTRVSSQVIHGQEDLRNDVHASSREIYLKRQGSSRAIKSDHQDAHATLKKDLSNSEVSGNGYDQFHFSIYKWPGKGVSLATLIQGRKNILSKERGKAEVSTPVVQGAEVSSENQENNAGLNTMKNDIIGSSKFVDEVVPVIPESEPVISSLSQNAGKGIMPDSAASAAPMDIGLSGVTEKSLEEESCITESKHSNRLFKDEIDTQGNEKMVKQTGTKEGAAKRIDTSSGNVESKKVQKLNGKKNLLNLGEATSSSMQDTSVRKEEKLVGSRAKGKIKEFVQIFNQETTSKRVSSVETIVKSTGVEKVVASKTEDQGSVSKTKAEDKEKVVNLKNKRVLIDPPVMEDQVLDKSEKPPVGITKTSRKIYDTSSERNDSTKCSESIPEVFEAVVDNMEESNYDDLQANCLVEELSPEHDKSSQNAQHLQEIQASDARIRKWSNGKQGNIRSLLSTLQYVLWPESGWKPVPLMDIIEGNSVRKAYQKALLCLHPDKLQQKGAAEHQKYIAEKVFDILQESWEHFNNLGSF